MPSVPNLADHLLDRALAEGDGERLALQVEEGRAVRYRELHREACQVGRTLREVGVGEGDRVLIALPEGREWFACVLGAIKLGAVAAPVPPDLDVGSLTQLLGYSGARAMVCDQATAKRASPIVHAPEALRHLFVVGGEDLPEGSGWVTVHPYDLVVPHAPTSLRFVGTHPDDPALWLFREGEWRAPLAAVHVHRAIADLAAASTPIPAGTRVSCTAPPWTPRGWAQGALFPLAWRACVVIEGEAGVVAPEVDAWPETGGPWEGIHGAEMRHVDDEVEVRSPGNALCYWRDLTATREVFRGQWVRLTEA